MPSSERLDWHELVRRVAADRESGASQIAHDCAHALIAYLEQEQPETSSRLSSDLWWLTCEILAGQPLMAPVVRILNRALLLSGAAEDPVMSRQRLREYAAGYFSDGQQVARRLVEVASEILPQGGTVLTLSHSAAVAGALAFAVEQGCRLQVICLESRPNYEGRVLAAWLSQRGLDVTVVVDAAANDGLLHSDLFVVGADSLTEQGVVNKTGTALVAAAAYTLKVPAYVVADQTKIWPACLGLPDFSDHPPTEVWEDAPTGITIKNRYFDLTPWTYWSGVVTETGLLDEQEVVGLCRSIQVDQRLVSYFV